MAPLPFSQPHSLIPSSSLVRTWVSIAKRCGRKKAEQRGCSCLCYLSLSSSLFVDWWHIDGNRSGHIVVSSCVCALSATCVLIRVTTILGSSANNNQSFIRHGSGACVTESMSVLTDPATYGLLNSELTRTGHEPTRQEFVFDRRTESDST